MTTLDTSATYRNNAAAFARVKKAFADDIEVIGTENNRSTIELTNYENGLRNDPPLVTATVYCREVDTEEEGFKPTGPNREDSVFFEGMERLDGNSDPLMCMDLCFKEKAAEILKENPWLASKIVPSPNKKRRIAGKHALRFPTIIDPVEAKRLAHKIVRVVTTYVVGGGGNYSTTTKAMAAACSPHAQNLIIADPITEQSYEEIVDVIGPLIQSEANQSLWNVLMIPLTVAATSQRSNKFILIHSLNPCLGDPATLYKIYSMLVSDKPVSALDPVRIEELEKVKKRILDGDPNYMRSIPVQAGRVKEVLKILVPGSPKAKRKFGSNRTSMWTINNGKIDAIKQAYNLQSIQWNQSLILNNESKHNEPRVPYVSTNDILTSWFMSQNDKSAIGCLIADIRGRHNVPVDVAGNYQTEIIYDCRNGETSTPAWIRASVKRDDELLKRHGNRKLPGGNTVSGGFRGAPPVSIVSNWSNICSTGVFQTVFLPHPNGLAILQPETHFPIILDHKTGVSNNIGWNTLYIFRYSEDNLGALVMAPPSATDETDRGFLNKPALFLS